MNAVPDFSLLARPSSQTVNAGGNTSYTISTSALNGFSGSVGMSLSGLPAGASASFSPTSISGAGSTTVVVTTSSTATPAGSYSLTITGVSGSLTHSTTATLVVSVPPTSGTGSVTISGSEQTGAPNCGPYATNCPTIYDCGTISITVNGHTTSAPYGLDSNGAMGCNDGPKPSSDTSAIVASRLASAINTDSSAFVTAAVSGSTITLTAKITGVATNYSLSAWSSTNATSLFSYPSFSGMPSGSTLTGGR